MSARKVGHRRGRCGGSEDKNPANKRTAEQLQKAHQQEPEELHIIQAELDAQRLFRDRQGRGQ